MRLHARIFLAALLSVTFAVSTLPALLSPAEAALWAPRVTKSSSFDPQRDLGEFEDRILYRINKARARHHLPKVKYFQSCVDGFSERWSSHLRRIDDLVHRDLTDVIRACDFTWTGETLVSGSYLRPAAAVRAWLHSPPHRAVILKQRAKLAGVGVQVASNGKVFAVLNFGDRS